MSLSMVLESAITEGNTPSSGPSRRSSRRRPIAESRQSRNYGRPSRPRETPAREKKVRKGICQNPHCTRTELETKEWRSEVKDGPAVLCNACGLYLHTHKRHRPKEMCARRYRANRASKGSTTATSLTEEALDESPDATPPPSTVSPMLEISTAPAVEDAPAASAATAGAAETFAMELDNYFDRLIESSPYGEKVSDEDRAAALTLAELGQGVKQTPKTVELPSFRSVIISLRPSWMDKPLRQLRPLVIPPPLGFLQQPTNLRLFDYRPTSTASSISTQLVTPSQSQVPSRSSSSQGGRPAEHDVGRDWLRALEQNNRVGPGRRV